MHRETNWIELATEDLVSKGKVMETIRLYIENANFMGATFTDFYREVTFDELPKVGDSIRVGDSNGSSLETQVKSIEENYRNFPGKSVILSPVGR